MIRLTTSTGGDGAADFAAIRAIYMRILLVASDDVVTLAQQIISGLENNTGQRAGEDVTDGSRTQLTGFARACRRELQALRR